MPANTDEAICARLAKLYTVIGLGVHIGVIVGTATVNAVNWGFYVLKGAYCGNGKTKEHEYYYNNG